MTYRIMQCPSGQYGLAGDAAEERVEVPDLFTSYREISGFTHILNEFDVAVCHVRDIVEDYFGSMVFWEQLIKSAELP